MKFHEYKAKELFQKYGIPVPRGVLVASGEDIEGLNYPVAVKAQVLIGGRGKAGGIKFASSREEALQIADEIMRKDIRGFKVQEVLVEEHVDISREYYLGITIDRKVRSPLLMASAEGGMEIESVPDNRIFKKHIPPFSMLPPYVLRDASKFLGLKKDEEKEFSAIARSMFKLFEKEDAELVEINPLALTKEGGFMAVDAKLIADDNALYRHKEFQDIDEDLTPLEKEAKSKGIAFIQLEGDIGVIANGAGLTMATLDMINAKGGRGGVFLDLGGTDDPEKVKQAFRLMKKARPSVVLLNIFGGITRCDSVALGVKEVLEDEGIDVPIVARIRGVHEDEAGQILRDKGFVAVSSLERAAEETVRLRGG
ncbi:MAG: ADP-forming succinate--CoA ligase subunit beta [Thermoplasmata archaeon]